MSGSLKTVQETAAQALLEAGVMGFDPDHPITFRSGIQSPVYLDNRRLPFTPAQWRTVIECFRQLIALHGIQFHVIAGIETAGIPHSAALGYATSIPSIFVRKQPKDHGTRSRIEGGDVAGKHVLLVEDLVTTGTSGLAGVEALREAGATVEHCLCIASYEFPDAQHAFDAAHVRLHPLVPFSTLIVEASKTGYFDEIGLAVLEAWMRDPQGWTPGTPAAETEETAE